MAKKSRRGSSQAGLLKATRRAIRNGEKLVADVGHSSSKALQSTVAATRKSLVSLRREASQLQKSVMGSAPKRRRKKR